MADLYVEYVEGAEGTQKSEIVRFILVPNKIGFNLEPTTRFSKTPENADLNKAILFLEKHINENNISYLDMPELKIIKRRKGKYKPSLKAEEAIKNLREKGFAINIVH